MKIKVLGLFFPFAFILMNATLPAQSTSAADNLAELQSSFSKARDTFLQELSSVPDQPSKLEDGTIQSEIETLCGKDLKDLLDRVNNQRDILKKKLSSVEALSLSESDKTELRSSISAQKNPLDTLEKQISSFRDFMQNFKSDGVNSLKTVYEQFSSIEGAQVAADKLRNRIAKIEAPYLPKPTPSPKVKKDLPPTAVQDGAPSSGGAGIQITESLLGQSIPLPRNDTSSGVNEQPQQSPTPVSDASASSGNSLPAGQPWWLKFPKVAAAMQQKGPGSNSSSPKVLEFQDALRRADNGDAYAQAVVSIYYSTGYMAPKNLALAAKYAVLSARQKNPLGVYRLGVMRESGEGGIAPNPQEGLALKSASFEGLNNQMPDDPYAMTALGVMCFRGEGRLNKNPAEAARLYRLSADMGYAPAQYCYSACLYNGQGVQRNPQLAEQYWRLACAQKYPPALKGKPLN